MIHRIKTLKGSQSTLQSFDSSSFGWNSGSDDNVTVDIPEENQLPTENRNFSFPGIRSRLQTILLCLLTLYSVVLGFKDLISAVTISNYKPLVSVIISMVFCKVLVRYTSPNKFCVYLDVICFGFTSRIFFCVALCIEKPKKLKKVK